MDNLAAPIPSTSPQPAVEPEVFTPSESSNRRWILWSAIGLTFLIFGIVVGVFGAKFLTQSITQSQISSYEDCLAAKGSIVQYSYPATCVTASGQRFVQPLTDEEKQGLQPPDLYREPADSAATANWKMYTDAGISFKFPPDWVEEPIQPFGSRSVVEFKYKDTPLLELTIMGNYNQLTGKPFAILDEYIGPRIDKAKNITVNGLPAKIVTDPGDSGHIIPYEEVILFSPNKSNIISLYYKDSYYNSPNKVPRTLDQILSTFKFLDQNE